MPEEYNKIAEGIVKGSVPMVASFVERYITDDEPGFFAGDRERIEGDIRVHVTVFAYLEQPSGGLPDSTQLGIVDLQQLPDERAWMVVGVLPRVVETETWLNDVYSEMVRRMASRLVQFGFLDAPHRPRLKPASTLALTQVAQAARPAKAVTGPATSPSIPAQPNGHTEAPAANVPPAPHAAPAPPPPAPSPAAAAVVAQQAEAESAVPVAPRAAPPPRAVLSPTPLVTPSEPNPFTPPSAPQLDLLLTVAMVFIWLVACGMLSYLLFLLLK